MLKVTLGPHARRWISVGVIAVVAGAGGATAWAVVSPSGPSYRTAAVTRASVTASLQSTGTVEPVSQADVSFPVSGQVTSVPVTLGSQVKAGQVLARLSTTTLASDVSAAEYTVAQATVRLATDEASETTTTSTTSLVVTGPGGGGTGSGGGGGGGGGGTGSGGGGGTGSGGGGGGGGTGGGGGGTGGGGSTITKELAAIAKQQGALIAAQQQLDYNLAASKALLAVATADCATTTDTVTSSTSTPTASPSAAPSTASPSAAPSTASPSAAPSTASPSAAPSTGSPQPTTTPSQGSDVPGGGPSSGPPVGPHPESCQAATTELLSTQTVVANDEQSVANSESALTQALSQVYAAITKAAGTGSGGGGTGGGGTGGGGTGGGSHGGGTGSGTTAGGSTGAAGAAPATAQQIAADQASLDEANAQLSVARQDLAAATLVAPISGKVALVNVTPGQQVTGSQGSGTSADFVIEGAGGEEVTTTVGDTQVGEIRVGQPTTITLDGSATAIRGEVVAVGALNATSSSGSASYPVTIGLTAAAPTLFAGSDAQVAITLAQVNNTLTVPTSAVESIGTLNFVTVMRAGKPTAVRVVVGATGPVLTQITSGLTVGEQVVLADMNTPLPTNSNPFATRGLTTGGGGGFPVGGGGGFPGGAGGGGGGRARSAG